MRKHLTFLGLLLSLKALFGATDQTPPVPPEVVEKQLEEAESEFEQAKKMFNPWYAGPLLTPSAHILPPGMFNMQPYLFFTNNFAKYSESGHPQKIPHLHTFNPALVFQFGIISWMDAVISAQGIRNSQQGQSSTNWGDSSFGLGFGLVKEGSYRPAVAIQLKETFPSGKYQRLNPHKNGVDSTGAGSYQTTFSFNVSKVVWWWILTHPMAFRASLNYTVPALVTVHGFNSYGGGFGTHGKVRPGKTFTADIGYEFSFTQMWVLALDIVYTYSGSSHFSGHPGVDATGAPAVVGGPFNDQLSLAPALEYNPNENLGLLAGVWFTVWGRNSLDFVSGVLSLTYTF